MKWLLQQLEALRHCCADFPDPRTGENVTYSAQDIAMAALSASYANARPFLRISGTWQGTRHAPTPTPSTG